MARPPAPSSSSNMVVARGDSLPNAGGEHAGGATGGGVEGLRTDVNPFSRSVKSFEERWGFLKFEEILEYL